MAPRAWPVAAARGVFCIRHVARFPDWELPRAAHLGNTSARIYAGGWRFLADIEELLRRNPDADLEMIGETRHKYRLGGWEKVLEELRQSP